MSFYQRFTTGFLIAAAGLAVTVGAASAQQCPDWQLNGIPISTDAETAWTPQRYQMFAGGGLDLSLCTQMQGRGFVTAAPNFSISYDARNFGRDLEFRVESTCDTTLLINDASAQWIFNDDEDGTRYTESLTIGFGVVDPDADQPLPMIESYRVRPANPDIARTGAGNAQEDKEEEVCLFH